MLQTNDRVGRCVTAQALLEESQPCHDSSAEMQVTFLKKNPNKVGFVEEPRGKKKQQTEALATGPSQWQPNSSSSPLLLL